MHPKTLPVFRDISFNPAHIETYIPMEPMHPLVFDRLCEDGWCYWSDLIFRRNYWEWRGHEHFWVAGTWVRERHGYRWEPAHWEEYHHHWRFIPGEWVRN